MGGGRAGVEGIRGGGAEGLGFKAATRVLVAEESLGFRRLSVAVEADDDCEEVAVALVLVLVLVLGMVLVQSERGFRTLSLFRSGSASIFGYFFTSFILLLPVWLFYVKIGEFSRKNVFINCVC